MGYPVTQATTTQPLEFWMADSSDHVTGKTGLAPTVTISKNGGAFASPSGAVTEIGNGWYKVAGNATDNATLGPLLLYATATGADPATDLFPVVAYSPQNANSLGLGYIAGDIYARLGAPAGASASADIAAIKAVDDAVKAKTDNLPAAPASTTNITAGVITTTTNLTNAPTNGDLTATMKTSVTSAVPTAAATATAVWANGTRDLTTFGTLVGDIATAVWAAVTRTLTAISDSGGVTTLLTRVPAALVGGRMDSSVGAMAASTVTAAAIATDAIGSDELAASAVTKIAAGITVSAPTVQQISTQIERAGGMMESTLIAASAAAGGVSGSSGAFAVLGLRTRLSGQESEDYITVHAGDDKTVAIFFEDASRNYAPCPVVPTAALLDVSGAAVGTATISDSKIEVGYLLVRLQVAGSGNPPATLRLSFAGGSGAAFSHDIPVRAF